MKKIMISQPMRGKTTEQIRNERAGLVSELESKGYKVIDTILPQESPEGCMQDIYLLGKTIEYMSMADEIVFMKGWEKARGCIIEHMIAEKYGITISYNYNRIDDDFTDWLCDREDSIEYNIQKKGENDND